MKYLLLSAALLSSGAAFSAAPVDGWYTSVFGGYTYFPDNLKTDIYGLYFNGSGYKSGYNAGARVGYQSNPLRYELEYTYLHAELKHFLLDYQPETGVGGYTSDSLLMANVYYDCPDMLPAISPFLGFGIGYAHLQVTADGTGPFYLVNASVSDNAFAYQGTAGLTYNFAENYAVNLAYRYVATAQVNNLGRVFQAHIANAGVVYRFDQGNYK